MLGANIDKLSEPTKQKHKKMIQKLMIRVSSTGCPSIFQHLFRYHLRGVEIILSGGKVIFGRPVDDIGTTVKDYRSEGKTISFAARNNMYRMTKQYLS